MPAQEWSTGPAHGFRKVQIVEELAACAGAFYNLYLVDVNVFRRNVCGAARSFHHETTPGLEAQYRHELIRLEGGSYRYQSGLRLAGC